MSSLESEVKKIAVKTWLLNLSQRLFVCSVVVEPVSLSWHFRSYLHKTEHLEEAVSLYGATQPLVTASQGRMLQVVLVLVALPLKSCVSSFAFPCVLVPGHMSLSLRWRAEWSTTSTCPSLGRPSCTRLTGMTWAGRWGLRGYSCISMKIISFSLWICLVKRCLWNYIQLLKIFLCML